MLTDERADEACHQLGPVPHDPVAAVDLPHDEVVDEGRRAALQRDTDKPVRTGASTCTGTAVRRTAGAAIVSAMFSR